jgi:hypothetical protein
MGSYTFLLSSLTSSQIWLSPLVDDRQPTHLPHKLGKKTLPIKHSMGSYTFLLSSLTNSQIWLSPNVDDCQPTHLPHKLEKKKHCPSSLSMLIFWNWEFIKELTNNFESWLMTCGHPWSTYYPTRRRYKKDETGKWTKFKTCALQIHWGHHITITALNDEGN